MLHDDSNIIVLKTKRKRTAPAPAAVKNGKPAPGHVRQADEVLAAILSAEQGRTDLISENARLKDALDQQMVPLGENILYYVSVSASLSLVALVICLKIVLGV